MFMKKNLVTKAIYVTYLTVRQTSNILLSCIFWENKVELFSMNIVSKVQICINKTMGLNLMNHNGKLDIQKCQNPALIQVSKNVLFLQSLSNNSYFLWEYFKRREKFCFPPLFPQKVSVFRS